MSGLTIKWEENEINFLKENYSKYGVKYCSEKLKRSELGVILQAKKLKIKWDKIKEIYLEENLRPIIENNKSYSDCLIQMGLRTAGGNTQVLKKYIKKYNIDISHFESISDRYDRTLLKYRKNIKVETCNILVENSSYSRSHLKNRIIKENILEYKCSECNNKGEWNNKKLTLQLDHKNGIHNDNRLENLRFLCPNCHSQTETFCR